MPRLSAPTRKTFAISFAAIALGILAWIDPLDLNLATDLAFWLTAAGSILLVLGNVFNRL